MSSGGSSAPGARLAEMDRLLRDIQAELAPGREPPPALLDDGPALAPALPDDGPGHETTSPAEAPVARPVPASEPRVQVLSELSAGLLASMRELLAGYERVLVGSTVREAARRPAHRRRPDSPDVTLSAAPFPSVDALHEFEAAVARLPNVREVAVHGFEGTDRAIIEVRLDPPR